MTSNDDAKFRREYARSLAEAIAQREREESSSNTTSKDNANVLLQTTYSALCFDDPQVVQQGNDACFLLANALVQVNSPFRISDRLVDGIKQATARSSSGGRLAGAAVANDKLESDKEQTTLETPSLLNTDGSVATAAGYAMLALTCFVKIPLHCCQSPLDMHAVQDMLGSFRGPKRALQSHSLQPCTRNGQDDDDDDDDDDDHEREKDNRDNEQIQALSQGLSSMSAEAGQQQDSDDASTSIENQQQLYNEYEELWAAESDPSDFEYESAGQHDQQQAFLLAELDQWSESAAATAFDPMALSKPPLTTEESNWADLQQAVANLVSELSYSKLAPLSSQQWQSLRISQILSQLALTLLIQPENASAMLLNEDLQQLGVQPLFVLRDRVANHHGRSSSSAGAALADYLTLLQTLIAVDAVESSSTISTTRSTSTAAASSSTSSSLAPATIVGLGALSALCHATEYDRAALPDAPRRIRQCVLEMCEELSHIIEKQSTATVAAAPGDDPRAGTDSTAVVRLIWTLLPLLDRITNVSSEGTVWETSSSSITNADAQLLLQTGLFRQLILLYTETAAYDESASAVAARIYLLRSIEIMCVQSISLLGKYAWRVPDLARIVQTSEFAQERVVDGLMWNLLGSTLASGPVRLRMKNVPVVTADDCRGRALASFERLMKDVKSALNVVAKSRTGTNGAAESDDAWKEPILELSRFSNYLLSCPSLATQWRSTVMSNEDGSIPQDVQRTVDSLGSAISKLPRLPESDEGRATKSADNDKAGGPRDFPASAYGEYEEASVRRSVKILSSSLQSGRDSTSSKTD